MSKKTLKNRKNRAKTRRQGWFWNICFGMRDFFLIFLDTTGIHGLRYLGKSNLMIIERIFWLILIVASFTACISLSLISLRKYETKSTVTTIETNHYYWNTTLPSLTICPAENRINRLLFENYCDNNKIYGRLREEFYLFLDSLANSTYENFDQIKDFPSIEDLRLHPKDYMRLIYTLTEDLSRRRGGEHKVRVIHNLEFGSCEQVLTENGICYTANNAIASNLSTRMLIFNERPTPMADDIYYRDFRVHDIISGNLFDSDMGYNFVGFSGKIRMFIHSTFDTINIAKKSYISDVVLEFHCLKREFVAEESMLKKSRVTQRGCRFLTESNLTHYRIYTKLICLQECRLNLAYRYCNCIPHFYPNSVPNPKPICNYKQLKGCIFEHKDQLLNFINENGEEEDCYCEPNCIGATLFLDSFQSLYGTNDLLGSIGGFMLVKQYPLLRFKRKILFTFEDLMDQLLNFINENGKDENCYCEPNCIDSFLFLNNYQSLYGTNDLLGSIGGFMLVKRYPILRYKRKILFTFEDLMVSIGGTAGLFIGFSVLGAIEIIYFFTLRLYWYIKGRR